MPVEYTKARTVWPGKALSSRDYNTLALAFNDRLKAGVADPSWRLFWYAHSLFRGMRNPDSGGNLWPAEDEWWKFYSHIPKDSDVLWPATSPGTPEGINVANPLGAFLYGREPNLDNEADRLNPDSIFDGAEDTTDPPHGVPLYLSGSAPSSNEDYWTLAKHQRGAWHPSLGKYMKTAVALTAAQKHGEIAYPQASYYLKGYGGFHANPALDGTTPTCEDGYSPNYELKFQSLVSGVSDKTYGTCPENPADVYMVWEGFTGYNLLKYNGTVESLPLADWLEGPYSANAYLGRVKGQQLNEALNYFAAEFRGSETQRDDSDLVVDRAFPFQDFLTAQYPLAPAYGTTSGGNITAQYPSFTIDDTGTANDYLQYGSASNYTCNDSFAFAGYYAKTSGASWSGTIKVNVLVDQEVVHTIELAAGEDRLHYFRHARPAADVAFQLAANMPSGAGITIEIAELLHYLPGVYDAYTVLRLSSCKDLASGGHDDRGETFAAARTIGERFLERGVISNYHGNTDGVDTPNEINTNPVYESARRLVHDNLRLAERDLLTGYEVQSGKSILYFKRHARGMSNKDLDVFRGIAAPDDNVPSGQLVLGEKYKVTGGRITWNGGNRPDGYTFTVETDAQKEWIVYDGTPSVIVYDGIRSTPLRDDRNDRFRGQTNEWQMFLNTTVYKPSDSSIYKAEAYGDVLGFLHDRCALLSNEWKQSTADANEIRRQVAYGMKPILRSENPPGYRYLLGTHWASSTYFPGWNDMIQSNNTSQGSCTNPSSDTDCEGVKDHLESCQIYVPDYEVESVVPYSTDQVKVTLKSRLRNHSSPTSIGNSLTDWQAALTGSYAQDFRTDENAILDYLVYQNAGTNCTLRIGDVAPDANSGSGYYSNDFFGSCLPRFYFSRHVRHVWNDEPDNPDPGDTPVFSDELIWMEFILQAICGGFIDSESTLEFTCTHQNRLYDFTFPNLCQQALKAGRADLKPTNVTKTGSTLSWTAPEGILYSVYGIDSDGARHFIASGVRPDITTSTSYPKYLAYGYARTSSEVVDYIVEPTSSGGHKLTWTATDIDRVRYRLLGRNTDTGAWQYWTGSTWSSSSSNATDADTPVTIGSSSIKSRYRLEADYAGSKRWLEFLPADIREDNAQGFGPFPNTNLYARIFNNLANGVNLLRRARIDLPFGFETRESAVEYWAQEKDDSGIDTSTGYPFDYSCTEGTTKVAASDNYNLTGESSVSWSETSTVTDRALVTAATAWSTSSSVQSQHVVTYGPWLAACGASGKQGAIVADGGNFQVVSKRYTGEIRIKDDAVKYALPDTIRDQFTGKPGFIGVTHHHLLSTKKDSSGSVPTNNGVAYSSEKYLGSDRSIYSCDFYEDGHTVDGKLSPFWDEFKKGGDIHYDQRLVSGTHHFAGADIDLTLTFTPFTAKPMFITIDTLDRDYTFQT